MIFITAAGVVAILFLPELPLRSSGTFRAGLEEPGGGAR
jgi:hypothetical protein